MRLRGHKRDYNCWLKDIGHYRTSYEIVKHDNCQIILLENYSCNDKYELEARERHHIENTQCINKVIPTRSKKEYILATKDKKQEYDKERRERFSERIKEEKTILFKKQRNYKC
jgi:hypothetical protein